MAMRIYDSSEGGDPSIYIDDATGQFYRMTDAGLMPEGGKTWESQAKPLYDAGWSNVTGVNTLQQPQEGGGPPSGQISTADTDAYRMMSGQLWAKTPSEFGAPIPAGYESLPRRSYADWQQLLADTERENKQTDFIENALGTALFAGIGGLSGGFGLSDLWGSLTGGGTPASTGFSGTFNPALPGQGGAGLGTAGVQNMDWIDALLKETGEYGLSPEMLESGWNGAVSNAPWWSNLPVSGQNVVQSISKLFPGGDSGSGSGSGSLLGNLFGGGSGGGSNLLEMLGKLGAAGLGAYASDKQSDALSNLANKYQEYGAPSRARYEASMTPGFDPTSIPGYSGALDTASKGLLARLSTQGNPYGSPGGLMEANKQIVAGTALPAVQEYQRLNANTGFGSSMNAAMNLQTGAIDQDANKYNALGYGLNQMTQPQTSFDSLIKSLRQSGLA